MVMPVWNSPVRRALTAAMRAPEGYDLREWLSFDSCPIEVCRQYAADIALGCYTTEYGEAAERAFCTHAWEYYRYRDKQAALDLYVRDLNLVYVHSFTRTAGAITGLQLEISPRAGDLGTPADRLAEFRRAVNWLLPWFAALITLTARNSVAMPLHATTGFGGAKSTYDIGG